MDDVTIFVSTFDRYQVAWEPFCYSLKKYWADCPWPVWFLTNHLNSPCGKALKVGGNTNWTAMQRRGLERVPTKVVLFLHEDLWFRGPVNTQALRDFANLLVDDKADRVYLVKGGGHANPQTFEPDPRLAVYPHRSLYRTGTHALWKVSTFLSLLRSGETAWEFEKYGNIRSQETSGVFLFVKSYHYVDYIGPPGAAKRGKWTEPGRRFIKNEGLNIDLSVNLDGTRGWV